MAAGRFKGLKDGRPIQRNERNVAFRAAGPNWEGKVNWTPPLTGPNTIRRCLRPALNASKHLRQGQPECSKPHSVYRDLALVRCDFAVPELVSSS